MCPMFRQCLRFFFFPSFSYFVLLPETLLVLNRREATCACRSSLLFIDTKNGVIFSDDETEVALQLLLTGCLRGIKLTLSLKAKQTVCWFALCVIIHPCTPHLCLQPCCLLQCELFLCGEKNVCCRLMLHIKYMKILSAIYRSKCMSK